MEAQDRAAIEWLLASKEPAVRLLASRDVVGDDRFADAPVLDGEIVRALLTDQASDGGFGVHPSARSTGAARARTR